MFTFRVPLVNVNTPPDCIVKVSANTKVPPTPFSVRLYPKATPFDVRVCVPEVAEKVYVLGLDIADVIVIPAPRVKFPIKINPAPTAVPCMPVNPVKSILVYVLDDPNTTIVSVPAENFTVAGRLIAPPAVAAQLNVRVPVEPE